MLITWPYRYFSLQTTRPNRPSSLYFALFFCCCCEHNSSLFREGFSPDSSPLFRCQDKTTFFSLLLSSRPFSSLPTLASSVVTARLASRSLLFPTSNLFTFSQAYLRTQKRQRKGSLGSHTNQKTPIKMKKKTKRTDKISKSVPGT